MNTKKVTFALFIVLIIISGFLTLIAYFKNYSNLNYKTKTNLEKIKYK